MVIQGYIFDIVIECSPEDGNHFDLKDIQVVIIGSNNPEDEGGSLARTSLTTWEYRGVIELHPEMGELIFVVQLVDGNGIGYLALTKEDVKQYVGVASSSGMRGVEHKFAMEADSPALFLMFAISGMRQNQETTISLPWSEDGASDLDEIKTILRLFQEAGHLAEVCDSIGRPQEQILHMFGVVFKIRFERTGNLDDLSKAIEYQQHAVAPALTGQHDLPSWLNDLGTSFDRRFELTGNLDDVCKAIEYQKRAVALTPEGHADMPLRLNNLGTSFACCFEQTGNVDDLSETIDYITNNALLRSPSRAMPKCLQGLAISGTRSFAVLTKRVTSTTFPKLLNITNAPLNSPTKTMSICLHYLTISAPRSTVALSEPVTRRRF